MNQCMHGKNHTYLFGLPVSDCNSNYTIIFGKPLPLKILLQQLNSFLRLFSEISFQSKVFWTINKSFNVNYACRNTKFQNKQFWLSFVHYRAVVGAVHSHYHQHVYFNCCYYLPRSNILLFNKHSIPLYFCTDTRSSPSCSSC